MLHSDSYFFDEFPSSIRVVCGCSSDMTASSDRAFKALPLLKVFVSYEHGTAALGSSSLSGDVAVYVFDINQLSLPT